MTDPLRHRSSTLKPAKPSPARLDVLPPRSHRLFTPAAQLTPLSVRPAPTPASPAPTHDNAHSIAPAPHTGGIRAHLAHLLPRHAAFTVSIILHQLHNVPLVHGEFALKWRIKGVTSHSGNGILDKVKARKAKGNLSERAQSATSPVPSISKGSDTDDASILDAASTSDAHSLANSSSTHSRSNDHVHSVKGSPQDHAMRPRPVPIPAVVVSSNHATPPQVIRSDSGMSITSIGSVSSISSASLQTNGRFVHNTPGYLSAGWSRQGLVQETETLSLNGNNAHHPETPSKHHYSPAKGITPFVRLKEHSVVWEETLKFVVQMSVGRDNGELGNCLAKFVVMQRVVAGDPDAPRNPRLGAVYLNLAQYVDAGVITRRYLLRQSKTNATLKLTIHLEHTAGELAYVAPPLPKGEILSEVAGFLESSDIYRTRPRASDLYTHSSSGSSSDDVAVVSGSDASSAVSGSGASNVAQSQSHGHHRHGDGQSRHATAKRHRRPFDVAKLPTINDPRGTEKLIEALFNPVPVTRPGMVTPFTYLIEVDEEVDGDGDGNVDADVEHGSYKAARVATVHREQGTRTGTVDGGADDDGSLYTDTEESAEEGNGMGSEYHSVRSHPSLQGSLRSKGSTRSLASKAESKRNDGGEGAAASTSVQVPGEATERRTWWQKVLRSPAAG